MLETTTRQQLTDISFEVMGIATLETLKTESRENMLEAWDAQSKMTAEEGYNTEANEAATRQAVEAQERYYAICDALEDLYSERRAEAMWDEFTSDFLGEKVTAAELHAEAVERRNSTELDPALIHNTPEDF